MRKLGILVIMALAMVGCDGHRHTKKEKVHTYKVHISTNQSDSGDSYVYWYVINMNDGGTYSAKSTQPVTNYQQLTWSRSATLPKELQEEMAENEVEETTEADVAEDSLDESTQDSIDSDSSSDSGASDAGGDAGGDGGGGDGGGGGD